ncbi:MAG: aminotransferase class I/II-fold pyridoxal phosphate-dependent enzyme, partial [Bacteroidales bacterium]|nr:aminotransferase class I/II-fold pyridoxal phosphate-dependent enzyme [Bacteroidales bacterium]
MINATYKKMLEGKSIIRELSEYATARGKEIGYENVFDYSLGNPSVPCPKGYTDTVISMYQNNDPMSIHGYSPSLGIEDVRAAVAESLRSRFNVPYEAKHIFMAIGAAGALAHAFRLVTEPGDEIIVFAPFFPEYTEYIGRTGAVMKVV